MCILTGLNLSSCDVDWNQDFLHQDDYIDTLPTDNAHGAKPQSKDDTLPPLHWARIEFLTPVYCPMDSLVIGSRLDTEVNANACRLAFSGRLVTRYDEKTVSTYTSFIKLRILHNFILLLLNRMTSV